MSEPVKPPPDAVGARRPVAVFFLAWLAVIGFDFFLHAGLLASRYEAGHPFLLDPGTAFRRIPLGYVAFGLFLALLTGLCLRLGVRTARGGGWLGLLVGGAAWGSLCLALASIATAPPSLLLAWFLGQTVECALAGMVIGAGLGARRLRRLGWSVAAASLGLVAAGVVLQNL